MGSTPGPVLQHYLDAIVEGRIDVSIERVCSLDENQQAHCDRENNRATGKLVVRVDSVLAATG